MCRMPRASALILAGALAGGNDSDELRSNEALNIRRWQERAGELAREAEREAALLEDLVARAVKCLALVGAVFLRAEVQYFGYR